MQYSSPAPVEGAFQRMKLAEQTLDDIPLGCYVLDANSCFAYLNRKAEEFLGVKSDDVLGKSIWSIFPEMATSSYFAAINNCISNKQPSTYEYQSPVTGAWLSLTITINQENAMVVMTDCSELKTTQVQLMEEQRRLKAAQKIGQIGYYEHYLDSEELYYSEEFLQIHGLQSQSSQLSYETFIAMVHPEDQGHYRLQVKEGLARKQPFEVTNRIIRKDGEVRLVNRRAEFLKDGYGNVNRISGTVQDITRQATTDLFLNNNNEACFELDGAFRVVYANCKAYDTWFKTPAQVMGKWIWDVFPEHLGTPFHKTLVKAFDDKVEAMDEAFCPVASKWFYIHAAPVNNGLMVFYRDTTELVQTREKVEHLQAQQQQEVFKATISTQEEERKRIAESLHNGIGQILYGIKMSLDQINLYASMNDQTSFYSAKRNTEQLLDDAIKETRRISHELTPTILEDFGLKEAISDICNQFNRNLYITCNFENLQDRLDKYIEISVYRMVQELVINIIKHAHASRAGVEVEQDAHQIVVTVWDDGIGFDQQHIKGGGIGLLTTRNKVKLLNGSVVIDSSEGTRVTISIPYQHQAATALHQ